MTITVPYPRILLAVILAVGLLATVYAVAADDGQRDPPPGAIPVGDQPELPVVTPEESARAREALLADPTFARMAEASAWKVTAEIPSTRDGQKVGVGLVVDFSTPVDSSGPWKKLLCQGTKTVEFSLAYEDLSTVGFAFDDKGSIISITPLGQGLKFDEDEGARLDALKPDCPKGFEDEEN